MTSGLLLDQLTRHGGRAGSQRIGEFLERCSDLPSALDYLREQARQGGAEGWNACLSHAGSDRVGYVEQTSEGSFEVQVDADSVAAANHSLLHRAERTVTSVSATRLQELQQVLADGGLTVDRVNAKWQSPANAEVPQVSLVMDPAAGQLWIERQSLHADVFARAYGLESIGLRYFNVFGPRQDPEGAYAAVIPGWIAALLRREPVQINGDGETSLDFCYIENVVQANLLAATTANSEAVNQVFNIAIGERTTLNELFDLLQEKLRRVDATLPLQKPVHRDFRPGDVQHSLADISKAATLLGYAPTHRIQDGLELAMDWYRRNVA